MSYTLNIVVDRSNLNLLEHQRGSASLHVYNERGFLLIEGVGCGGGRVKGWR